MSVATEQVPGIQRRRLGDVLVTAVNDGFLVIPAAYLSGIDEAGCDAIYRAAGRRPPFASAINAFLLQSDGGTVLVDTGAGPLMGAGAGRLLANLGAAGVTPADIDTVLLTHLHADHAGGLLDESGAPRFAKADVLVAAAELAYWRDDAARDAAPEARRGSFDMMRSKIAPYGERLRGFTGTAPLPGVTALPLPGHTPGHTGFAVAGGGETLVIWGDICHVPEVQCARPEVTIGFDVDPAQAIVSRRMMLERALNEDLLVTGMHLSFPGFSRIVRDGDGYRLQAQPWQYDLAG